jgi:hypothetical protein
MDAIRYILEAPAHVIGILGSLSSDAVYFTYLNETKNIKCKIYSWVLADRAMMSASIVDTRIATLNYGFFRLVLGVAQGRQKVVVRGHHLLAPASTR